MQLQDWFLHDECYTARRYAEQLLLACYGGVDENIS